MELNSIIARNTYINMINRLLQSELLRLSNSFGVILLTGPRQSGKTTLCKSAFPNYEYVTLENLDIRAMVSRDPIGFLSSHSQGLIIDEAQNLPELFSYLQVVVDEHKDHRFILTGSSNFSLMEQISQSLAGRAAILRLAPLSITELKDFDLSDTDELMVRGFYPGVWGDGKLPYDVYSNYYATYIERDLRQLINVRNLSTFQQFVRLMAGSVGCEFNAAKLSNAIGVDIKTIQSWVSTLEASYILFRIPPYYNNIGKRIVKAHKLYFYDVGLACYLLGIENSFQLAPHPLRGNLFENMIVAEFLKRRLNMGRDPHLYFYRDASQKEVDLLEEVSYGVFDAYEIKSSKRYSDEFAKGLNYISKLYPNQCKERAVIFDGPKELSSDKVSYLNFRTLFA